MVRIRNKVIIFKNANHLAQFGVRRWIAIAKNAIRKRGRFAVIVSGGKTPEFFYRKLAKFRDAGVWQKTHVFWADERFVSRRHSWNNYRMVYKNLLRHVPFKSIQIHPVSVNEKTVRLSALKYEQELKAFFQLTEGRRPQFDLAILGIGDDGHTASLFPVDFRWKTQKRFVIPVVLSSVKFKRISLGLPVLNSAANVFFLVIGRKKAKILPEVLKNNKTLPASRVKPKRGQLFFLVDREAACRVKRK